MSNFTKQSGTPQAQADSTKPDQAQQQQQNHQDQQKKAEDRPKPNDIQEHKEAPEQQK